MSKEYSTPFVNYSDHDDYVAARYIAERPKVNLENAKEIVASRYALPVRKPMRLLMYGTSIWGFTKDALTFLGSDEGVKGISAIAIVYDDFVLYSVMLFLNMFFKKSVPTEIFHSEENAKRFLLNPPDAPSQPLDAVFV
jgi:hypothetical protein